MNKRVEKVGPGNSADFFKVHSGDCGWCYCTAWWTPGWDGWTERTDEENRKFRQELFEKGEYDGYLLYADDNPIGWCQVGKRDRLSKLVRQYELDADNEVWAISCFVIKPEHRNRGHAVYLLKVILEELQALNIKKVQAFPKRTASRDAGAHWRGPIDLYLSCGFKVEIDDPTDPILAIEF